MTTQLTEGFTYVTHPYIGKGASRTPGWFLNTVDNNGKEELSTFTADPSEREAWLAQNENTEINEGPIDGTTLG